MLFLLMCKSFYIFCLYFLYIVNISLDCLFTPLMESLMHRVLNFNEVQFINCCPLQLDQDVSQVTFCVWCEVGVHVLFVYRWPILTAPFVQRSTELEGDRVFHQGCAVFLCFVGKPGLEVSNEDGHREHLRIHSYQRREES